MLELTVTVFYLYSRVAVPPKRAWISDYTLSTYVNYHSTGKTEQS